MFSLEIVKMFSSYLVHKSLLNEYTFFNMRSYLTHLGNQHSSISVHSKTVNDTLIYVHKPINTHPRQLDHSLSQSRNQTQYKLRSSVRYCQSIQKRPSTTANTYIRTVVKFSLKSSVQKNNPLNIKVIFPMLKK